jgi:hypothetical protein
MPDKYPAAAYHEDGRMTTVDSEAAAKALGKGWSDKPADIHTDKMRAASGGIGETIVPVQRTRMETI